MVETTENNQFPKTNFDLLNDYKISETNESIVNYLYDIGEPNSGEYVSFLINQKPRKDQKPKEQNTELVRTNNKILDVLNQIHEDMFDEQDTSITKTSNADQYTTINNFGDVINNTVDSDDSGMGFGFGRRRKRGNRRTGGFFGGRKRNRNNRNRNNRSSQLRNRTNKTNPFNRNTASNLAKNSGKNMLKAGGRLAAGGLKLIPGVGWILAGGMAVYDGFTGWGDAANILGKDESEITTSDKAISAAGSILSGLTMGLVDESVIAKSLDKGVDNIMDIAGGEVATSLLSAATMGLVSKDDIGDFFNGNEAIEKYEKQGIIDHDYFGNSEIDDWGKLAQLSPDQIEDIIRIDDWSDDDLKKMKTIQRKKHIDFETKSTDLDSVNQTELEANVTDLAAEKISIINDKITEIQKVIDSTTDQNVIEQSNQKIDVLNTEIERIVNENPQISNQTIEKIDQTQTDQVQTNKALPVQQPLTTVASDANDAVIQYPEATKQERETQTQAFTEVLSEQTNQINNINQNTQNGGTVIQQVNQTSQNINTQKEADNSRALNVFTE